MVRLFVELLLVEEFVPVDELLVDDVDPIALMFEILFD
jgi:hypothetical protein